MLAGLGKGESRIAAGVAPRAPDRPADRERRRDQVAELQAAAQDLVTREPGRALAAAELAVALARRVDDPTRLAATRVLGRALFASGRYRDSSAVLKRLAAAHERRGEFAAAAGAHSGRIASLLYVGRPAEALDAAARARTYFRRAGDRVGLAKLDVNTGIIFHRLDRMPEALACYRRARRTFRREGDPHHVAVIDLNCALAHSALGHPRRAVALFERARHRFEQTGQTTLLVSTDYNRACDEFSNGRYDRAWCAMEQVRGAFASLGDPYGIALADLDLAEMALALGAADRALGLGRRAGQGFVALGIGLEAARARRLEAVALARTGSPGQARKALEQSLAGFAAEGRSISAARVTLDLAALLVEVDPARAARLARAGGTALRRAGFGKDAVRALLIEGRALATSEPRRARALLGRAGRLARRRGIAGVDWQSDAALAGMARAAGDLGGERRLLHRALGAVDRIRTDVRGLDLAAWVLADCSHLYEEAIRACLGEGPGPVAGALGDRVLVYAERARSRALADALAAAGSTTPAAPGSTPERAPVARLRRSLDDHYHALHHRRRFDLVEDDVLGAIDREERALSRALGGWARLRMGQPADLPHAAVLRAALAPGQELVEYQRLGEELVAIVARREGATVVRLPGRASEVTRRIQDLSYQIRTFGHGPEFVHRHSAALAAATEQVLAELGRLLLAPIEPLLSGHSLVFVPTGDLHGVPFAALRRAGRYLIETRTVSVAPSAQVLSWIQARRRAPARPPLVIGVGDELAPEVRAEAHEVAGLFPGSLLLVGSEADRATVSREVAGRSLVHVATHGYFRPERPTLSSLQLADGCLTLHDVLGLKVAADLVTLAACHSGESRVRAGDEIVGLARGFLQAGARSVLASHWALDDASARRLMRAFYRGYQAGKGKAGALRLAMIEVMAIERHPYYWAPFALVGAA